jgi:hypothetical protein
MIRATLTATVLAVAVAGSPAAASKPVCHEDQKCFQWRTMGNHKRGVTTIDGRRIVVGPFTFDALNRMLLIDWTATRYLRSDGHRFNVQNY